MIELGVNCLESYDHYLPEFDKLHRARQLMHSLMTGEKMI